MNGCQRIEVAQSARDDLEDGFWFYEAQQAGIGDYFLNALQSDIDSLLLYAGVHEKPFDPRVYRRVSTRFPYAVYYTLSEDVACVVAVLDTRRDPRLVQHRVQAH